MVREQMIDLEHDKYLQILEYLLRPEEEGGANNSRLGKVKLMKLLYFADFEHFYRYGTSITGDTYVKKDFGPVPRSAEAMLAEMATHTFLAITRERVINYFRYVYELQETRGRFDRLTKLERETLDEIIDKWKRHSMQDVILASHGDPPWKLTAYNEDIPYELVYYRRENESRNDDEPDLSAIPIRRAS